MAVDHVARVIKTYRIGDQYNIIFPRAKANLRNCLQDPVLELSALCQGPLQNRTIWRQMLGLAMALDRILYYDAPPEENPNHIFLGYHFDIKPANILVSQENVFQIADFGQAKFKANGGNSAVTNDGGTEEYAAPEFDSDRGNSKYDVWSLGCIFAEIFTFVLKSYDGVGQFEGERAKCVNPRRRTKRYYDEFPVADGQGFERKLKPAVKAWLDGLPESCVEISVEDLNFLKRIRNVILQMLIVNVHERWTSRQVYQELQQILEQVSHLDSNTQANGAVEPAAGGVEVCGELPRSMR